MVKILLLLTIVCLPLYVFRTSIFGVPTTALELLIVLTTIYWIIAQIRSGNSVWGMLGAFKTPLLTPGLLILISSLVAVFASLDLISGLGIFKAYFLEPFILFNLIYFVFKKDYTFPLFALILSGWVVAIPALVQFLFHTPLVAPAAHELYQGRVSSFFNSANSLALYLGPIISLLPLYYHQKNFYSKLFLISSSLVFILVVLLTKSAGALIGLGGVLAFALTYYLFQKKSDVQKLLFYGIAGGFLTVLITFSIFLFNISAFTPKTGLVYPRPFSSTFVVRLCLWEGTRNLLVANPVLGSGLNSFGAVYFRYRTCDTELLQYPHNIFLNFWVETGIAGLVSFFLLLFVYCQKLGRSFLSGWTKVWLLGFLIYFFLHGLFDVPYFKNDLSAQIWVYLALGLVISESKRGAKETGS